jgi:hypothetical protein
MRIAILDDYQNVALRESGDVTPHPVRDMAGFRLMTAGSRLHDVNRH